MRVLGSEDDTDIAIDLIIAEQQFETEFSQNALDEANACAVSAEDAFASGYRDLTGEFIFTIDPVDARDFDDAVSLEREGEDFLVLEYILQMFHAMWRMAPLLI